MPTPTEKNQFGFGLALVCIMILISTNIDGSNDVSHCEDQKKGNLVN